MRCPTLRGEGSRPYTQMLPRGQALGTIQLSSEQKNRMKASSATPRGTQPTASPWKVHGETWASKGKEQSNKEGTGPREERVRPRRAAENGHLLRRARFGGFMTSPQALSNAGVGTRKEEGRQSSRSRECVLLLPVQWVRAQGRSRVTGPVRRTPGSFSYERLISRIFPLQSTCVYLM